MVISRITNNTSLFGYQLYMLCVIYKSLRDIEINLIHRPDHINNILAHLTNRSVRLFKHNFLQRDTLFGDVSQTAKLENI